MMMFTRKLEVGSLMLILFNISISLMSFANFAVAAPSPAVQALSATTSSSTSANGLPLPSKMPTALVQDSLESKNVPTNQLDSQLTSELHNQALSSRNHASESVSASMKETENQKAHHNQGESSVSLSGESNNEIGKMSKAISGEKAAPFVGFPAFSKQIPSETRYQRQRRSYPIPSLAQSEASSVGPSFRFTRPDELELRLDDDRDRETFLKLMSIIASNKNNKLGSAGGNGLLLNDELSSLLNSDNDDLQDDDVDEDSLNLGTFQRPVASPYWTPSLGRPSEPINLMSSLLAAEPPRTSSSSHSLYGLGERPLDIGISRRAMSYRDEDDNDGEWMEEAVPLMDSHFKTRRSGPIGNKEFTFNPVKSHFRRYLRAVPLKSGRGLEFMANGGQFGRIAAGSRFNRRRRATPAMTANAFPAVHWM